MSKRAAYVMVAEDDAAFMAFWNAVPLRTAKKDARRAWAVLNPSPELVQEILTALAWQTPMWAQQGYGAPYPATYLNGERWTDECPTHLKPRAEWICPHVAHCNGQHQCRILLTVDPSGVRYTQRKAS
jgi:hypothetical protein